jgi:hypothetical protein
MEMSMRVEEVVIKISDLFNKKESHLVRRG